MKNLGQIYDLHRFVTNFKIDVIYKFLPPNHYPKNFKTDKNLFQTLNAPSTYYIRHS